MTITVLVGVGPSGRLSSLPYTDPVFPPAAAICPFLAPVFELPAWWCRLFRDPIGHQAFAWFPASSGFGGELNI